MWPTKGAKPGRSHAELGVTQAASGDGKAAGLSALQIPSRRPASPPSEAQRFGSSQKAESGDDAQVEERWLRIPGDGGVSKEIRPWYRWWWYQYRTSERVLSFRSLAVHGAYQNLLAAGWELGGSLPNDRSILWRLALAISPEEYEQVADQVEAMFTPSADGKRLNNETLQNEWDSSSEFLNQRREAGKASGKSRREHPLNTRSTKPERDANTCRTSSSSSSSSSTGKNPPTPLEPEGTDGGWRILNHDKYRLKYLQNSDWQGDLRLADWMKSD